MHASYRAILSHPESSRVIRSPCPSRPEPSMEPSQPSRAILSERASPPGQGDRVDLRCDKFWERACMRWSINTRLSARLAACKRLNATNCFSRFAAIAGSQWSIAEMESPPRRRTIGPPPWCCIPRDRVRDGDSDDRSQYSTSPAWSAAASTVGFAASVPLEALYLPRRAAWSHARMRSCRVRP